MLKTKPFSGPLSDKQVLDVEGFRAQIKRYIKDKKSLKLPPWFRDDSEVLRLLPLNYADLFYEKAKMKTHHPELTWIYERLPNWTSLLLLMQER
jgi:hypothetical protein